MSEKHWKKDTRNQGSLIEEWMKITTVYSVNGILYKNPKKG
jgi:hypothetical protein